MQRLDGGHLSPNGYGEGKVQTTNVKAMKMVDGMHNHKVAGSSPAPATTSCQECGDTGEIDHGGTYPWGEYIMLPCPVCKPGEYRAAMAPVQGPTGPTDEQVEEYLEKVLKMLNVHDPVVGGINVVMAATKVKPEDHLLDMTTMDEEWFKAKAQLREAIREMIRADEFSWW